jgi:DNA-binding GntR family transcriptional regulator
MRADQPAEPAVDAPPPGSMLRARRELAAAIRRGDYKPNQRLVESELTVVLGVSRPTLRAVFVALEQENYIMLERNRGARVRQFSPVEADEILEAREIIESALAGLAAAKITKEECGELESIVTQMIEADRAGEGQRYSACNRQFHARILAAADQPTLAQFLAATPYPLVMSQYRDLLTRHPREGSLREHQAILAALQIGNGVAAEAGMRAHLAAARRALTLNRAALSTD